MTATASCFLHGDFDATLICCPRCYAERLERANEKLRAARADIADGRHEPRTFYPWARDRARAALGVEGEQEPEDAAKKSVTQGGIGDTAGFFLPPEGS